MPVNIGVNIQRSPNRINQQLREAGVEGKFPKLLLDFKDQYYLASGGSKTLANAVTHARSGNAVMTDGYGPELVVNGGFDSDTGFTKGDGWSIRDGHAYCDGSQSATTNLSQTVTIPSAGAYIFEFNVVDVTTSSIGISYTGGGTATVVSAGTYVSRNTKGKLTRVFTFSSGGTFTVVGAAFSTFVGTVDNYTFREMPVLKWAPHNLALYSEDLSNWPTFTRSSFSSNVVEAPNGTVTADKFLVDSSAAASHWCSLITVTQSLVGDQATFRCFCKAAGLNYVALYGGSVSQGRFFNLSDGSLSGVLVGAPTDSSITDMGNGWYLCSITVPTASSNALQFYLSENGTSASFDGDGSSGVYLWGAHVYRSDLGGMVDNPERGDSYVPTTTAAKYLSRVGHHVFNGSAWTNEGLLAESEARTNLFHYSHDFSDSYWGKAHLTVTADQGIAPDGTNTAFKLIESSTSNIARHVTRGGGTLANSTQYTAAVYLKKGTRTKAKINVFTGAASHTGKYDIENGTVYSSAGADAATIEDVGNGWFRCSITTTTSASGTANVAFGMLPDSYDVVYDGDGSSYIYAWGATLEASPTRSSYIPTTGAATVTRAAETFTIPSANLPWPSPQYIGSELVTNGDFSSSDDWIQHTTWNISGGVATHSATSGGGLSQAWTPTAGSVYEITFTITGATSGNAYYAFSSASGLVANQISGVIRTTNGTYKEYLVADATTTYHGVWGTSTFDGSVDNISVREINPLSVSIAMDGRMTYADDGINLQAAMISWGGSTGYIRHQLRTDSTNTGTIRVWQNDSDGLSDTAESDGDAYEQGILRSFSMAGRHGSTFINGALNGVAFTENTTPTELYDLSSTNLLLAYDYMGTVGTFRVWDRDITDAGLVEATNPSLEPSLSLTFEGVGTNSFVVNDWSE